MPYLDDPPPHTQHHVRRLFRALPRLRREFKLRVKYFTFQLDVVAQLHVDVALKDLPREVDPSGVAEDDFQHLHLPHVGRVRSPRDVESHVSPSVDA